MFVLNRQIVLLKPGAVTKSATGQPNEAEPERITTLAAFLATSGAERQIDAVEIPVDNRVFIVREDEDINESWSLQFGGFNHNVLSVQPIAGNARQRYMRITCRVLKGKVPEPVVNTGPQPVWTVATASEPQGSVRTAFMVDAADGTTVDQPEDGDVTTLTGDKMAGEYLVWLFPQAWGEPTEYYTDGGRAINQIGAFRFSPARLQGVTGEYVNRYTAMTTRNRILNTGAFTHTVVWG